MPLSQLLFVGARIRAQIRPQNKDLTVCITFVCPTDGNEWTSSTMSVNDYLSNNKLYKKCYIYVNQVHVLELGQLKSCTLMMMCTLVLPIGRGKSIHINILG